MEVNYEEKCTVAVKFGVDVGVSSGKNSDTGIRPL